MSYAAKVVLHAPSGVTPRLGLLVGEFIRDEVRFVGVVGKDCARIEDLIDELCVGDGSNPYGMLTSSHPGESPHQAVEFARSLTGEFVGEVQVVEL